MPGRNRIPLNGYGHIGRLILSGGDALSYEDIKIDEKSYIIRKEPEPPVVMLAREDYDRFGAIHVAELEKEYDVRIVATDEALPDKEIPFIIHTNPVEELKSTKLPTVLPSSTDKSKRHKTPHIEAINSTKKRKHKVRQQKQSRKKNRR